MTFISRESFSSCCPCCCAMIECGRPKNRPSLCASYRPSEILRPLACGWDGTPRARCRVTLDFLLCHSSVPLALECARSSSLLLISFFYFHFFLYMRRGLPSRPTELVQPAGHYHADGRAKVLCCTCKNTNGIFGCLHSCIKHSSITWSGLLDGIRRKMCRVASIPSFFVFPFF